ncbi:MAG: hypothetical protein HQL23_06405 [Candidatus Omnitrophica bacterium]|nr:hypothetical protein [Candidatus Omnitrophota bacterium]
MEMTEVQYGLFLFLPIVAILALRWFLDKKVQVLPDQGLGDVDGKSIVFGKIVFRSHPWSRYRIVFKNLATGQTYLIHGMGKNSQSKETSGFSENLFCVAWPSGMYSLVSIDILDRSFLREKDTNIYFKTDVSIPDRSLVYIGDIQYENNVLEDYFITQKISHSLKLIDQHDLAEHDLKEQYPNLKEEAIVKLLNLNEKANWVQWRFCMPGSNS